MLLVLRVDSSSVAGSATSKDLIERFFQTSLFLLVATGFLTLASTGRLDIASLLGVSLALLLRAYLLLKNRVVRLPQRFTSIATLIYVLFYLLDFAFISQSYV